MVRAFLAIAGEALADGAIVPVPAFPRRELGGCPEAPTASLSPSAEASRPIAPDVFGNRGYSEDDHLTDHVPRGAGGT